jgi:hypothetical protein
MISCTCSIANAYASSPSVNTTTWRGPALFGDARGVFDRVRLRGRGPVLTARGIPAAGALYAVTLN